MRHGNRGRTTLRLRRRSGDPMRDYDRLPGELRAWLANAVLPWRPRSVRRAFDAALSRTSDSERALSELDRIEARLIARDVRRVWEGLHPFAETDPR
jgi:hypothetical protein